MVSSHLRRFLDEVVILESFKLMILFFLRRNILTCGAMWGVLVHIGVVNGFVGNRWICGRISSQSR